MRRLAGLAIAALAAAASAAAADGALSRDPGATPTTPAAAPSPDPARAHELLRLLRQDCGSCHGMRLTGGLGPPLTPEALRARSAPSLVATIVSGRAGTAMPPWRRFVSEAEAEWLVARMLSGEVDAR